MNFEPSARARDYAAAREKSGVSMYGFRKAAPREPLPTASDQAYKKGGMVKFEASKKDVEVKGMKEGSRKEEALDRKQLKCGGKVKK